VSTASIALVCGLILSFIYLGLAIIARGHMKHEHRANEANRLLGLTLWWPFYDFYGERAKGLRAAGIIVLALGVAAYVAWVRLA
jgi:hypothetical protein